VARGHHLFEPPVFGVEGFAEQTLALGTVGAASQADIRLLLIGVILPIGFNGYIVARWAGRAGAAR